MLNIEEILEMSEDMGVEIVEGISGKHYILNDLGEEVEFKTEMIIEKRTDINLDKIEMKELSINLDNSSKMYNMSSSVNPYEDKPKIVNDYITYAA